ncbi:hypothetical protein HETIRDRAFT_447654 [Heterobasidion irregulare TC 32-1]|uniref:Uncharacterized protein n=1 Tax=Heterobasidion irregulare (strain TC 32-1) TaxID=747525 RepID=W4KMK1_HETIT|nr:uncharacterized protein HETIRDRAFT_447654 [Heterobasidion irregulare TC 32-1]ETW87047.1 hypothetical protein HETIRDRAFT_447654 [Heterobasidion irregulare TC 32-1]
MSSCQQFRVRFPAELEKPPADRPRKANLTYPKVAQVKHSKDRIESADLYWGHRCVTASPEKFLRNRRRERREPPPPPPENDSKAGLLRSLSNALATDGPPIGLRQSPRPQLAISVPDKNSERAVHPLRLKSAPPLSITPTSTSSSSSGDQDSNYSYLDVKETKDEQHHGPLLSEVRPVTF